MAQICVNIVPLVNYSNSVISYFRLRDNSVHLQDFSPFVLVIFFNLERTLAYLLFYVDMRSLIGKALKHLYMCIFFIGKSNIT